MKKFLLLTAVALLFSCSDDSSEPTSDFLRYSNSLYTISDGLYVDFGTEGSSYLAHYNYDLLLTDGEAFTTANGRSFSNPSYIFYVELFSAGAASFDDGVFNYIADESPDETSVEGQNWFSLVLISKEALYEPLEEGIESGTIDLAKTGDSFTLVIDLELKDGSTLNARYDGPLRKSIYLQKID